MVAYPPTMGQIAFADVVHQTIYFSEDKPADALILRLIDTAWFQRLRDIAQTGNGSLVYMFSEHSRFGHSLGVAYLANLLMDKLEVGNPREVRKYRVAVAAAALLHDIGHIAPGSHAAYRTWFPGQPDIHEDLSAKIILEDPQIIEILQSCDRSLPAQITQILEESDKVPPWCWEIISGSGWNVDRGNWCMVDSVMAGVSYGRYNISALMESIVIDSSNHLAIKENRLDAMMHFAIARHSMYRQVYHHRVLLASEMLNKAIVMRARDLGPKLGFADSHLQAVLAATSALELSLANIFAMRESWWRYHLTQWSQDSDPILRDLSSRLLNRNLFKTVRISQEDDLEEFISRASSAVVKAGFDPKYYLHHIVSADMHSGELQQPIMVLMDDGRKEPLQKSEPLWSALVSESKKSHRSWLTMPLEAKNILGRSR